MKPNSRILIFALLLTYFVDALNSFYNYEYGYGFTSVSIYLRAFLELFFFLFFFFNSRYSSNYKVIFLFILFYITGTFFLTMNSSVVFYNSINSFFKIIFYFILWMAFDYYFSQEYEIKYLRKIFENIILLNSALIIIGYTFDLAVLASYNSGAGFYDTQVTRFGYKGLFPEINAVSAISFLGLWYFYKKIYSEKSSINIKAILSVIIISISCFLSGAKAAMFAAVAVFIIFQIIYNLKTFILVLSPVLAGLIVYFWGNITYFYDTNLTYISSSFMTSDSLLEFITTGRFYRLVSKYDQILSIWRFPNFIFGGYGGDDMSFEMDFVDMYIQAGVLLIVYFVIFIKKHRKYLTTKVDDILLVVFILMAFFGGHIFSNAVVIQYYLMFLFCYRNSNKRSSDKKEALLQMS